MELLAVIVGGAVILGVLIDMVITVIGVSGGHGLISSTVSRALWKVYLRAFRRNDSHEFLRTAGPAIFVVITVVWAALLALGWTLVFTPATALGPGPQPEGILQKLDAAAALVWGGISPQVTSETQPWSFVSQIAAFTGLALASFGLAYALPVVQGVVRWRRLARLLHALGGEHGDIRTTEAIDEEPVTHLFLVNLVGDLAQTTEEIRAYPIVPFFHSKTEDAVMSLGVARLNDYLDRHHPDQSSVPHSVTIPLRKIIDELLEVIQQYFLPRDHSLKDAEDKTRWRSQMITEWRKHDGWDLE